MDPLQITAGELCHRVKIQSQGLGAPDSVTGSPSMGWNDVRVAWAKITTPASREAYLNMQFTAQVTHMVTIRWTATPISAGMRVAYGSRYFAIQAIENVLERSVRLNLMCQEIDGVTS